jgi:hypothetical protein
MSSDQGFKYCPNCGAEYRPGFTRCHDCDVELVDELPVDVPEGESEDFDPDVVPRLVEVFAASRVEAELVRSALAGHGIPAVLAGEGYSSAYPLTVGALGEGRVLVPEERGQEALEVIGTLEEEEPEPEVLAAPPSLDLTWLIAIAVVIGIVLLAISGAFSGP